MMKIKTPLPQVSALAHFKVLIHSVMLCRDESSKSTELRQSYLIA